MALIKWTMFLILVFATALFVYFNPQSIPIDFILGNIELPITVVLLGSLLCGVILGTLLMSIKHLKVRHLYACLEKQHNKLKQELDNLRTLPLKD